MCRYVNHIESKVERKINERSKKIIRERSTEYILNITHEKKRNNKFVEFICLRIVFIVVVGAVNIACSQKVKEKTTKRIRFYLYGLRQMYFQLLMNISRAYRSNVYGCGSVCSVLCVLLISISHSNQK